MVKIYQCVVDTAYVFISLFQRGLTEGVPVRGEGGLVTFEVLPTQTIPGF